MYRTIEEEKNILFRILSVRSKKSIDDLYRKFGSLALIIENAKNKKIKNISSRNIEILEDIPKLLEYYLLSNLNNIEGGRENFSFNSLVKYLRLTLKPLKFEMFALACFDSNKKFLCIENIFRGSIDTATIYPRDVIESALKYKASYVVFAHNHPSGIAQPSRDDIEITYRLYKAFKSVKIKVVDHIVIGGDNHFSFLREGILDSFLDTKEIKDSEVK